jgi:hypothetical protein
MDHTDAGLAAAVGGKVDRDWQPLARISQDVIFWFMCDITPTLNFRMSSFDPDP